MKRATLVAIALTCSLAAAGCMSERYAQHYNREHHARPDTLALMTKEDVITLSKAKVNDDVIIRQIRASRSYFELSTQDIVDLANAGVSDKVIEAMINADEQSQRAEESPGYYYYPAYYWYDGYPYWYGWYPSFYLGFSARYYHPYYGYGTYLSRSGHYGYHGSFGGRGFGGTRSGGRHR